jgi:O-antigen biosynthesis protein
MTARRTLQQPRGTVSEVHQRVRRADQFPVSPIAVGEFDLADPQGSTRVSGGEPRARLLIRDGPDILGEVEVSVVNGAVRSSDVILAIRSQLLDRFITARVRSIIETPAPSGGWEPDLLASPTRPEPRPVDPLPSMSVVICTRDRPDHLRSALTAVVGAGAVTEIIVVDNAPSSRATRDVVESFAGVDYVVEPVPGLDRARNRGLATATGDIIAYTDDDTVVDSRWAIALGEAFAMDEKIWAVTGLVVPLELATPAQQLFERQGGFGRGSIRRWNHRDLTDATDRGSQFLGAGDFGTGANMAFRRTELERIGGFDPALDVGTPTGGGGDLNAMFEVLHHGGILVYEPRAVVRHHHRRDLDGLAKQIAGNGGFVSHVNSSLALDPALTDGLSSLRRWFTVHFAKRLLRSLAIPGELPTHIVTGEIVATIRATRGTPYRRSVEQGRQLGDIPFERPEVDTPVRSDHRIAVRSIDVTQPIADLDDVAGYRSTRIHVRLGDAHIGRIRITNGGRTISRARVLDALAEQLGYELFRSARSELHAAQAIDAWHAAVRALALPHDDTESPTRRTVTVVVATRDRPDELAVCLESLVSSVAASNHDVDVIVVDNNPASGLTRPIVERFSDVAVVDQPIPGLSSARNAGFRAATGDIVLATDDDVDTPPGWIDLIVRHFDRDDVMAVCGNVLPYELETPSQMAFEDMKYLGKGDRYREVTHAGVRRPVTRAFDAWELGATANAAFRRVVFDQPEVGLMNTALGTGTPSGCSEDSFYLYRIARAGHTIVYDPSCWVRHRHRRTPEALQTQLTGYFRGAVAHQLATLEFERDLRAIPHLARFSVQQTSSYARALLKRRPTRHLESARFRGALGGPAAFVRARRRAIRIEEGRSSW